MQEVMEHFNVSLVGAYFLLPRQIVGIILTDSICLRDSVKKNCNAQCRSCNRFDEGNIQGYRRGLITKYGEPTVLLLESMKNQVNKITDFEYKAMIDYYKKEIKRLKQEKQLKLNA